ncbi:MAG: HAMP domain-containing protein, partial [Alphaproteobacteria bacterium]|nr:HAMP domain-containing protein [Alphaproteobacteria bacterium]
MNNVSDTTSTETAMGLFPRLRQLFLTGVNERSLAYFSIGVALILGAATFGLLSSDDFLNNKSDLVGLLIGVDILAVTVLLFFVGRQVFQLIRERRNRLAGYQLHWKLVTLFGVITVFPAVIVIAFSYFVLDFSLRGWFNERISTAINESVTVADAYLEEHILSVRGQILAMANDINREASSLSGNRRAFDAFLTNQAGVRNLSEALVLDSTGRVIANSRFAYAVTFSSLGEDFYSSARDGDVAITRTDITNRIRAGVRLNQFVDAYLLVGRFIDPNVSGAVDRTQTAVTEYQSLDIRQLDLKVSFAILFGMVALLLVLGSVWVGINFANAIIMPLGAVIQVAEQVRSGNLASRVPYVNTNDEIAQLGLSFNRMLEEVARNREELVEANRQIDKRREFTEAVLAGVSSGVIGIDENKFITLPNLSALEMLGLTRADTIGRKLVDIVPEL